MRLWSVKEYHQQVIEQIPKLSFPQTSREMQPGTKTLDNDLKVLLGIRYKVLIAGQLLLYVPEGCFWMYSDGNETIQRILQWSIYNGQN